MAKIINLFGLHKVNGLWGLEHEVEGRKLYEVELDEWETKDDGSLRGAYPSSRAEYVLRAPLSTVGAIEAVSELDKALKENGATYSFSFRTSTHVHMNVQDLDEEIVLNICMAYYLLEPAIISLCGEHRVNNRFCLRFTDADSLYNVFKQCIVEGLQAVNRHAGFEIRYAALNLNALPKFGSLEFRSMQGTLNPALVEAWLKLLFNLRKYATKKKNLVEVYDDAVNLGYDGFVKAVLGEYSQFLPASARESFNYSLSMLMDFPHIYRAHRLIKEAA